MNNTEYEELKIDIEAIMILLSKLQKIYRAETGRDFVRPIQVFKCEICGKELKTKGAFSQHYKACVEKEGLKLLTRTIPDFTL